SASYPHVELIAHTGTFEEAHALFKSGAVDLTFVLSNGEVPDLPTEPLGRYRFAFIATPDHPLAGEPHQDGAPALHAVAPARYQSPHQLFEDAQ
ncbi:MAG: hypothetical protein EBY99_07825, partial [Burkholderiaceae bacterium]|nr:hypothetical protein [Burkholderiaceae bacterium]